MRLSITLFVALILSVQVHAFELKEDATHKWYKGNTHTHTLWSDGDAAPEWAVAWYFDNGYDFLGLSDHNILSDGSTEKFHPIGKGFLKPERVEQIRERFGEGWVHIGITDGTKYMKLKTLPEIKEVLEKDGKFLLIQAEEITSYFPAVHVNALNLQRVIPPVNSTSTAEALASAVAILENQSRDLGIPMIAHLNHPNFSSGVAAEALLEVEPLQFFEIYNGHPDVFNWGREEKGFPPTDRIWDIVLSMRKRKGGPLLYGVATDDTHSYFDRKIGESNSGRGWIQVLADSLTVERILEAMKEGRFYSSTGVTLNSVAFDGKEFAIEIAAEEGVTYTTQFIGTKKGFDPTSEVVVDEDGKPREEATRVYSEDIGMVLQETTDTNPSYTLDGDELYVRAKIVSSKQQENPFKEGDLETAWVQPVVP